MMALNQFKFAEAYAEVSLRDKEFHTAMGRITGSLTQLKASLDAAARTAQRFLLIGAAALAAFVKVAADAEETANKFNAVFKDGAPAVRQWADELAKAVGRQRQQLEETLASFQAFFIGLGFGAGQAEEMSKKIQTLTIDFASFNNLSDAEASQRFISALAGSSEVLDRFGINTKQAALNQELLNSGIEGGIFKATEQEKALARLNIIFKAMGQQGAIGDAIRTQDSMANQFKRLLADVKDLAIELGQTFMPIAKSLVAWLVEIAKASKEWVIENRDLIVTLTKYGAIGLASIVIMAKMASGLVAIASAAKLANAAMAFLLGISGPAGWAALAAGVTAATVAVLAMAVVYDELTESATKAMDAVKKGAEEAKKAAAAAPGGAEAAEGDAGAVGVGSGKPRASQQLFEARREAVAAEAELEKAKAAAAASEKRIEENRARAQAERDKKLTQLHREMAAMPLQGGVDFGPLGELDEDNELVRLTNDVFGSLDDERKAALNAAARNIQALEDSPLPGVPSTDAQDTIRWMRQRDIARTQARVDTTRAAQRNAEARALTPLIPPANPLDWVNAVLGREPIPGAPQFNRAPMFRREPGEPIPGVPQFNEAPNVIRQQQALRDILTQERGGVGGRGRTEIATMAMSGVQAMLQQRLNQQPTQVENAAARQRDAQITATQDVSKTIENLNLGLQ
jgi:hypothetical protein